MAVVQISRIQVRRGQKNQGTGLPQLASGEIGWAIDTQELYIGNGSVAEGAPAVGNTKIITQHDDLFELADSYIYREGSGSVVTGATSASPIRRTLQDRLDDTVSVKAFGATGDVAQDATEFVQRALDQLYLNNGEASAINKRVTLFFPAGIYTLSDTVYIPPYATIRGEGSSKTVFRQTANARAVFQTVNDSSVIGTPADDSTSTYANQARGIRINGVSLEVTGASKGLVLQSCRDSYFEDMTIVGNWVLGDAIDSDTNATFNVGLSLNSKNGGVESVRNEFTNCHISSFAYGMISNWDINDNVWTTSQFSNIGIGVAFGVGMQIIADPTPEITINLNTPVSDPIAGSLGVGELITQGGSGATGIFKEITENKLQIKVTLVSGEFDIGVDRTLSASITGAITDTNGVSVHTIGTSEIIDPGPGKASGPHNNIWSDCVFRDIQRQAIYVENGTYNVSRNNKFVSCGNDGYPDSDPAYPIIKYNVLGNDSVNDFFSRTKELSYEGRNIVGTPYLPEVEGPTNYVWGFEHEITLTSSPDEPQIAFRLPSPINANQGFDITYTISSQNNTATRSGHMVLVANTKADGAAGTPSVTVSDEYQFNGDETYLDTIYFDAILRDIDNDNNFDTIQVNYYSAMPQTDRSDFKFKVETKQIAARSV